MENTQDKLSFTARVKSMLKVDFMRLFTMPLVYITAGISFALPVLILIMTAYAGGGSGEAEAAMEAFTNVWQCIGSASGTQTGMDLTGMCNINMLYFLIAVTVCVFVAEDYTSGYAKNIFAVRAERSDYVISKTAAGFAAAAIMIVMYFIGALIGGKIAGLSFGAGEMGASAGGIFACMLCKIFIAAVFVSIALVLAVTAKQRLWLSIVTSLAAGMLLFTMIPVMTPLNAGALNVIMCLAGGVLFPFGLGAASRAILNKTSVV